MSTPSGNTQTPFLDIKSFVAEETPLAQDQVPRFDPVYTGSPFMSLYETEPLEGQIDPRAEGYVAFLSEMYDEEFDQTIFELVNEAAALHEEHFAQSFAEPSMANGAAERLLEEHFEPLSRELERMLDAAAERFRHNDADTVGEAEVQSYLDEFSPQMELTPAFENFFGKIRNAIKKVAGKAVGLAKKGIEFAGKLALGPLFNRLKKLLRPLLKRVLQYAIRRLPSSLQPVAQKLAQRLGLLKELEDEGVESETPTADVTAIQREFNQQLAELMFATSEVEMDLEASRVVLDSQAPPDNPVAELNGARDQLIDGLGRLREDEDPSPLLESFIPAALPLLKMGLRLAGRKRVVNFLAKLLAKLITRFVGPQHSASLSRAIVDAGLRLVSLETTPQDEARAGHTAVAATVEETIQRVSSLPEFVLADQELLEAFALEAFEQAAAANLPQVLTEEVYRKRPELREAKTLGGAWVMLPLRGKKRYKKFSRVGRAKITRHKAREIESFGGTTLAEFLEEQLGLSPSADVEAEVHLYESIPGTMLPEVTRLEKNTPGLGTDAEAAYGQLHPLTPEAAGLLLEEPGLGRDSETSDRAARHAIRPGQRFYYLNIPGSKPTVPGRNGAAKLRRSSTVKVVLDFPAGKVSVYMFLSEVRAQGIAVKLKQQAHHGTVLTSLRSLLEKRLQTALGGGRGHVKIIHETVAPEQASGGALQRIPALVLGRLRHRLQGWILPSLATFLKTQQQQFISATEAPADGVTLVITLANPPGIELLRQALRGRIPSIAGMKLPDGSPSVNIEVLAGYTYV
jgi:hypothetical protein